MNLSIAKRLSLGLGIIIILNISFGVWVYQELLAESKQVERVNHLIKSNSYWSTLVKEAALTNLGYMDAIVDKSSGEVDQDIVLQREKFMIWFKASKNDAVNYLPRPEDATKWEALIPKIHEWERQGGNLFNDIKNQGSELDTSSYDDVLDGTTDEMIETGSTFFNELEKLSSEGLTSIDSGIKNMVSVLALVSGLIIFTSVIVGGWLVRALKRDMTRITGELTQIGGEISDVASELEAGSSTLDQMTSSQAAAVQETVSSMNEISAMVERSLENASNALSQSKAGVENASVGKQSVQGIVNSIQDISSSNELIMNEVTKGHDRLDTIVTIIKSIGEKSKVINDIVFQTKLLSFNASVEAARAGESGKGFAVVAEEVGNLAAMSGKAADEIASMLSDSIGEVNKIVSETKSSVQKYMGAAKEKIEVGISTAHACVGAFEGIVGDMNQVSQMIEEITNASKEQTVGVGEITRAMDDLDIVTMKGRSLADKNSSLSTSLRDKIGALDKSVYGLRLLVGQDQEVVAISKAPVTPVEQKSRVVVKLNEVKSPESTPVEKTKATTNIPDSADSRFIEL